MLTVPPGAGKTTVAAILAQRYTPSVHLHADDFWDFIRAGAVPPYLPQAHQQNTVVITALARTAATYAAGGYHAIVDGIIGPWFIERFCAAADPAPGQIHYLVLRPDESTTLHRAIPAPFTAGMVLSPPPSRFRPCTANSPTSGRTSTT